MEENQEDDLPFLKEEMEIALNEMASGKASGEDGITKEMLQTIDHTGKTRLLSLMNNIYDTGILPQDFMQSVFIALPKKPKANECKDHWTISLMAHAVKLLLKMITRRLKPKLEPEIDACQFGFRKGTGTREAIFGLRTLCARSIQVQQDLFLCFIDYEKAFDKVKHAKLIEILSEHDVGKKNLGVIKNLYWLQEAAIRLDDELTEWKSIEQGVRQGCVMSPLLFNFYSEIVMRHNGIDQLGLNVNGKIINNLRYADDTVLIATSEKELQTMVDRVKEASADFGLKLNTKKTKTMLISKNFNKMGQKGTLERKSVNIQIDGEKIEELKQFEYLGSTISNDGHCIREVTIRIAKAKTQFTKLKKFLCNPKVTLGLRKRMMRMYVWSTFLYGSETWTLNKVLEDKIRRFEMWCYRGMLKVSWMKRITNVHVLEMAKTGRELVDNIKQRKARFLGHTIRNHELLTILLEGKIVGKKARGRQRRMWLDDFSEWMNIRKNNILKAARDRLIWRTMVSDLRDEDGT